jgi:hypothetical protein
MIVTAPIRRLEGVVLLGILLLAAFLRFTAPGVVEFKRDEANLSYLALDFARGRSLPLLGISSSVGVPNSPLSVYLFSIPYLITSDPIVATQFVGLLNVIAVLLTYLLTRRYYGVGAGLLAALLYAVSPWGVIYSRKIWAQDLLPPFALATLLTGMLAFVDGKRWAWWLCLPLLSITAQIHYSALLLVFPVVYLIWLARRQLNRVFIFSLIVSAMFATPFIIGILQADLPSLDEIRALSTSAASGEQSRSLALTGQMIQYAALTIAGTEIHSLAGPQAYQQYLATVPDVYVLFGLLVWGVLLSAFWLIFRFWKHRNSRTKIDMALLLWLLVPIAAFSITWTEPYPHYLIFALPAAYIIFAIGVRDLWAVLQSSPRIRQVLFGLGGITLSAILVLQVVFWLSLVNFLANTNTPEGFGTPLQYLMPIRQSILARQPTQVIAYLDGQFVGTNDDTTVWDFLLYDVPFVRFVDENTAVYPLIKSLYLTHGCSGTGEEKFPLRTSDEGCYQVTHRDVDEIYLALSNLKVISRKAAFANGVSLLGYRWSSGDQPCFELVWLLGASTTEDYMFSIHFFNDDGQEVVNADGLSWRGIYWLLGDIVMRRFCLTADQVSLHPELAGVNIGMYTYDGTNFNDVDLVDAAGTPIGHTVSVPFN